MSDAQQRWRTLWWVRALTCISAMAEGYDTAVINGVLVHISVEYGLQTWEKSLLVGCFPIFVALGALTSANIADIFGRKCALSFVYLSLVAGTLVMVASSNFWLIVCGRAIMGLSVGAGFVCIALYIAEVVPAANRGFFIALEGIFLNIGMTGAFVVSYALHFTPWGTNWRLLIGLAGILPAICAMFLCCPFIPESPRWLLQQGREEEAREMMLRTCEKQEVDSFVEKAAGSEESSWVEVLCPEKVTTRRATAASVGTALIQILCGIIVLTVYSSTILTREMSHKEASFGAIVFSSVKLFTLIGAALAVDTVGRRCMILTSAGCMTLAMFALGVIFQVGAGPWVKVAGFSFVTFSFSLGLGSAAYVVITEVASNRLRSKTSAVAFATSRIAAAVMLSSFPFVEEAFGLKVCFYILAGFNAIGFLYVWWFVPETMKKSLEEMHLVFGPCRADGKQSP